jgi:urease accessory protein UreH
MGERFLHGALRQRIALSIDGRPAWVERLVAEAGDRLFASPLGWGGRSVACTVWAVTAARDEVDQSVTEAWRAVLARDQSPGDGRLAAAVTCPVPGLVVARLLADDTEAVMRVAQQLWAQARPAVIGAPGDALRIWAT